MDYQYFHHLDYQDSEHVGKQDFQKNRSEHLHLHFCKIQLSYKFVYPTNSHRKVQQMIHQMIQNKTRDQTYFWKIELCSKISISPTCRKGGSMSYIKIK